MSGYTPGPWVYSPNRDTHDSVIHQDIPVDKYGYYGPDSGGVVGSSEWIWLKDEDARLIAAAPDLLEALDCLTRAAVEARGCGIERDDDREVSDLLFDTIVQALNAIRKATEAAS